MATGGEQAAKRDAVRDAIRDRVISGQLSPGSRLVERQLAEQLNVSRVPVREALRALEREGFVEERRTRGMVVRELSDDDIEMLYEVREALEEILCRRLLRLLDDRGLAQLQGVIDRASAAVEAGDHDAAVAANVAFHEALVQQADSRVLASLMEPVSGRFRWLLSQHGDPSVMNAEHQQILAALRDRDADRAKEACRKHLATSRSATASRSQASKATG